MTARHRVVQWATGNIGLKSLRGIIEHPAMTLAGVRVFDTAKIGCDAGELCGVERVGVAATASIDDILRLKADCVVYMPRAFDVDEVCRLLEAGMNVVSTCGVAHHPPTMDPAIRDRLENACERGGSSIHSTGSSPGFISEAVPLVLLSVQRRLDSLTIDEYADLSQRNSPELLFDLMGFGREPAPFEEFRADYLRSSFGPSLRLVADAVGVSLDEITAAGELAVTRRDTQIAAGLLRSGTVAGQRITVSGRVDNTDFVTFRATWYCSPDLESAWDLQDTGWRIAVHGDAPLDVTLRMPIPLERMAETTPAYTANRAVNLVPALCAARPGIRSTVDLIPTPLLHTV